MWYFSEIIEIGLMGFIAHYAELRHDSLFTEVSYKKASPGLSCVSIKVMCLSTFSFSS